MKIEGALCTQKALPPLPSIITDAIMNTSYMTLLAIIRLFLLFFPLAYHSYTGTAVKCPAFYHLFYSLSLMILLGHMLAIIMLDPDSLTSLLPSDRVLKSSDPAVVAIMRHVWVELSLSLFSTIMHCFLLYHVRSTAPMYPYEDKRRKRVLYYYVQQQQLQQQQGNGSNHSDHEMMPITGASASSDQRRSNDLIQHMKLIPEGYDGTTVI